MKELTPREIVKQLDKYIIGQKKAKKSVAIALRNRYRRNKLDKEFQEEVKPKNIIMMGPTGVGKTEIARRLAKLVKAPFVKVEATKFTEVGYVGRDVESMIRDLLETSIRMVKNEKINKVYDRAEKLADKRIVEILVPSKKKNNYPNPLEAFFGNSANVDAEKEENEDKSDDIKYRRTEMKNKLKNGELEEETIEIEVEQNNNSTMEMFSGAGLEEFNINMSDVLGGIIPKQKKKRKMKIKEARKILASQEAQKLVDMDRIKEIAIKRVENNGIVFIDEIDKICDRGNKGGPDVSREGVQRDILPIIEGSTIVTKHGPVKTDHILFIAAGAFHVAKISDLIPEIQGRFPIRVELDSLTKENFEEILVKPQNALIKQYKLLLNTEGIDLKFQEDAIKEIAQTAYIINEQSENIGARRLHTILEELLEEVSFEAPEIGMQEIVITKKYVNDRLGEKANQKDLSKYIL
ncbi:MAG: ATP-dependent protease ATPase subunit HslU [Firmicutes bacterium]|nr:ATP-dependent protease ATPase subunit HslU [Bacillota bacterium]